MIKVVSPENNEEVTELRRKGKRRKTTVRVIFRFFKSKCTKCSFKELTIENITKRGRIPRLLKLFWRLTMRQTLT